MDEHINGLYVSEGISYYQKDEKGNILAYNSFPINKENEKYDINGDEVISPDDYCSFLYAISNQFKFTVSVNKGVNTQLTATITGTNIDSEIEKLVIPSEIYDFATDRIYPVTEIAANAFANLKGLKEVEMSNYVQPDWLDEYDNHIATKGMITASNPLIINRGAFKGCSNLTTVKIGGTTTPEIRVRLARPSEKLVLLDDKEIELNENDIVICSGDTPVALAGAMGGKSTAIDETTSRVIFEIASFSLYNLRKTQMSHGIFSEAITRFTKGRPASDLSRAHFELLHEMSHFGNVKLIGETKNTDPTLLDENGKFKPTVVNVSVKDINDLLGSSYSLELIKTTLENVEFKVEVMRDNNPKINLRITAPLWRADIHIKEDIIEEVGRLLGFDNLPLDFPKHPFVCPSIDPMFEFKSKLRAVLSDRLGMNELLTYSFVSKSLQEKAGENPDDSYQIVNSISPELECFRQSLLPSLLDKLHDNDKAGFKDFTLYELNQVSKKSWGLNEENVPKMQTELGLVTFGNFYAVKHILRELEKSLNLCFELKPLDAYNILEPLHSVAIYLNNEQVGELGEVKTSVLKRMKIAQTVSALRLTLDPCLDARNAKKFGIKLSKFPSVSRDLTVRVPINTNYADVETKIIQVLSNISATTYKLEPVSIYKKGITRTKNLSFHLEITNDEKTLESSEVSDIIETIVKELQTLGAEVV